MTVIACRVTKRGFVIAADSQGTRGYTQSTENNKFTKLFSQNGLIVGSTGTGEEGFLFQTFLKSHRPKANTAEAILELKAAFSSWKGKNADSSQLYNHYIIGYKGKAYTCEHYMANEIKTYDAIGQGMEYALAALYLGHTAREAVKVAIELNIYCNYPIQSFKGKKRSKSK